MRNLAGIRAVICDVMDLIPEEAFVVNTKADVSRLTLALTFPAKCVRSVSRTHSFITPRIEDTHIQSLSVNVRVDTIRTISVVTVPAINFIEIELKNAIYRISGNRKVRGGSFIVIIVDEPP